jgi:branched-chain amino acid transport system permease protein
MSDFSYLVQFFFSGLTSGSIYALIAVSLVIVYRASQLICFSQGEFYVFGALIMASLLMKGIPLLAAFLLSLLSSVIMAGFIQYIVIRRLLKKPIGMLIVMTIAISLTLRGFALLIWGRESYVVRPFFQVAPLSFVGATLPSQVFLIMGVTALVLLCLWLFFEKTLIGLAMRACAENPDAASLMGINVHRMSLFAWMWGGAIGAISGMVVAPLLFTQYTSGIMPMVKGFIAMSIGGLTGISGAALGGFLLGLTEAFTVGLVSSRFSDAIVFTILIIVLIFKPSGLFARSQ